MANTPSRYSKVYDAWRNDPEEFWSNAAQDIHWFKAWDRVFDPYAAHYGQWFAGGECNTAYNCLDRHVEAGHGDQVALIHDSAITGQVEKFSYAELTSEVSTLAGVMIDLGVQKGDRVIIYMPMIPQALIAMLACARIGAIHSVVFGGFAAPELALRIDDAKPKLLLTASCGLEGHKVIPYQPLYDEALKLAAHKPDFCLVQQREQSRAELLSGRDLDWSVAISEAKAQARQAPCVPVQATDPLYILYTSGTTGKPKGVVRDNGGHMVALQWTMQNLYGVAPGDVFWAASDVGWVVGHSYICYAPLLHRATTVMFEGKPVGTPDAGVFWRVIEQHKVSALFTAPTAFRAIKKEDPEGALVNNYDLGSLQTLFLAGERADPETIKWAEHQLKVPVIDHWWQTETGWAIAGNPIGLGVLPTKYGSPTVAMPGYQIDVLDDAGRPVARNETGTLAIKLPLPPGCCPSLWNAGKRFEENYLSQFSGYYSTSDAGFVDNDGYVFVMSRTDDVINVAGHRLSTGQMEEVVAEHADVAECAVVGAKDAMKGQMPVGFVVLNSGVARSSAEIEAEIIAHVRDVIGPVAAFKRVVIVPRLPKTRSGKVLRKTIRDIVDGVSWQTPATIDDPTILEELKQAVETQ